jgi:penicillin-binding protein 1C
MSDPDIFLIQQALSDSKNRARTFGISSILNSSIELPVKTGTSTDFRDNWAVSYDRDAIIGVWVGNSDASPMEDVS